MRTDIKVGAIAAIVLVVVGMVWYFAYYRPGNQGQSSQPKPGEQAKKTGGEKTPPMRVRTRRPDASGDRTLSPSYARRTAPPGDTSGGTAPVATRPTAATQQITYKPPAKTTGTFSWETKPPSRLTGVDSASSRSRGDLWPASQQAPTTYVVKKGDSYWTIAKDKYGDGTLWRVIQDANANIPPKALRPDMTIKVPPKPRKTVVARTRRTDTTAHGSSGVDITGKRWYVIKKGDNGFWGASKALFGTGKHYTQIAAMNPGVDPKKLHPGDKIWVPIKPAVTTRPVGAVAARGATRPAVARIVARSVGRVETGAPTRAVLPDGRVFD